MFKYIYTFKCGGKKNIYFIEHDIYFSELMFTLKNINLELKSALRTKYIFYRILLYNEDKVCLVAKNQLTSGFLRIGKVWKSLAGVFFSNFRSD